MSPKFADRPIVVMEQGGTAEAALDAMDRTIDSMTKTAVFFSLQTEYLWRNGWLATFSIIKQALGGQAVFSLRLVTESVLVKVLINLARIGSNLTCFVTTLSHHVFIDSW